MFLFIYGKVVNDIINFIIILDFFFINDFSEVFYYKIRFSCFFCCWLKIFL